jgi:opacity protein-like surface antigen
MASTRVRGGITWRRWLFYGVGGAVLQRVKVNAEDTYLERDNFIESDCQSGDPICIVTATDRRELWGWTAGFGGEFSVSRNLTLGLEFRHDDIGRNTFRFDRPIFSGAPEGYGFILAPFHRPSSTSASLRADHIGLRLNYRFSRS